MSGRWLLVGDFEHHEFHGAAGVLDGVAQIGRLRGVAEAVCCLVNDDAVIDWILLAQRVPGEFSSADVQTLQCHAPLARVICLLGSWCEGETRTGRPLPGVIRIFWHQWPERLARELPRIEQGLCSSWTLPVTATLDEQLLAQPMMPVDQHPGIRVGVLSGDRAMAEWLVEACRQRGFESVWLDADESFEEARLAAILCDGKDSRSLEAQARRVRQSIDVPLVALVNFARIEDHAALIAAGCDAILNKPVLLADIQQQLGRLVDRKCAIS